MPTNRARQAGSMPPKIQLRRLRWRLARQTIRASLCIFGASLLWLLPTPDQTGRWGSMMAAGFLLLFAFQQAVIWIIPSARLLLFKKTLTRFETFKLRTLVEAPLGLEVLQGPALLCLTPESNVLIDGKLMVELRAGDLVVDDLRIHEAWGPQQLSELIYGKRKPATLSLSLQWLGQEPIADVDLRLLIAGDCFIKPAGAAKGSRPGPEAA